MPSAWSGPRHPRVAAHNRHPNNAAIRQDPPSTEPTEEAGAGRAKWQGESASTRSPRPIPFQPASSPQAIPPGHSGPSCLATTGCNRAHKRAHRLLDTPERTQTAVLLHGVYNKSHRRACFPKRDLDISPTRRAAAQLASSVPDAATTCRPRPLRSSDGPPDATVRLGQRELRSNPPTRHRSRRKPNSARPPKRLERSDPPSDGLSRALVRLVRALACLHRAHFLCSPGCDDACIGLQSVTCRQGAVSTQVQAPPAV